MDDVTLQIQESTKVLNDIKTNLALSPSATLESQPPSVSPFLMPALVVSIVLNLVTGGAIVTNYLDSPVRRNDDGQDTSDPYQFISNLLGVGETDESENYDNDKMDRNESMLKYIGGEEETYPENRFSEEPYPEHRFSDMYTQDAYYDLPRKLYF